MTRKYTQICTICGGTDIHTDFSNPAVWSYGASVQSQCKSCGHTALIFPEISEDEKEAYQLELNKQIKDGKIQMDKSTVDVNTGFNGGLIELSLLLVGCIIGTIALNSYKLGIFTFFLGLLIWFMWNTKKKSKNKQ